MAPQWHLTFSSDERPRALFGWTRHNKTTPQNCIPMWVSNKIYTNTKINFWTGYNLNVTYIILCKKIGVELPGGELSEIQIYDTKMGNCWPLVHNRNNLSSGSVNDVTDQTWQLQAPVVSSKMAFEIWIFFEIMFLAQCYSKCIQREFCFNNFGSWPTKDHSCDVRSKSRKQYHRRKF